MNHKKKRPRNRRAGCKLCRPWKINGAKASGWMPPWKPSERRQLAGFKADEKSARDEADPV